MVGDTIPTRTTSPEDVWALLHPKLDGLLQEHFWAIGLNARCDVVGVKLIHMGRMDGIDIDMRCVFRELLLMGATSGIVAHNHPSGDPALSADDRNSTVRLVAAGKMLGLEIVDHVVVTEDGWSSYAEEANGR